MIGLYKTFRSGSDLIRNIANDRNQLTWVNVDDIETIDLGEFQYLEVDSFVRVTACRIRYHNTIYRSMPSHRCFLSLPFQSSLMFRISGVFGHPDTAWLPRRADNYHNRLRYALVESHKECVWQRCMCRSLEQDQFLPGVWNDIELWTSDRKRCCRLTCYMHCENKLYVRTFRGGIVLAAVDHVQGHDPIHGHMSVAYWHSKMSHKLFMRNI